MMLNPLRPDSGGSRALSQFLLVLTVAYVAKQVLSIFLFPAFSGHDEVAHYSYIRTLATEGRIPTLPDLEAWRSATRGGNGEVGIDLLPAELYPYCRYVLGWHCEIQAARWAGSPPRMVTVLGDLYPSGYQYAANHPPLYYALMTPLYWASASWTPLAQQYLLRFAAIPFGLVTVLLASALARTLFPGDAFLAVTTPALVAFQPQLSYEAAMVNNDIVSIALVSWITLLLVLGIRDRFPRATCLWLGGALGLALLAKSTSVIAVPVIAVAIILAVGWRDVRGWVGRGALTAIPTAIIAAPWYLFLYRTYGNLDALEQVAALQAWWNRPARSFLQLLIDRDFIVMRFRETWGEFGWRLIPLDPVLLWIIAVPTVLALMGVVVYAVSVARDLPVTHGDRVRQPQRWQRQALITLAALCGIAYLAVVQFGTTFVLTQARYFFSVAIAGSLLTMLGLRTLLPVGTRWVAQGVVVAALVVLTVTIFTQYVLPFHVSIVEEPGFGYYTYAERFSSVDERFPR
jgi:4-amino-4-deoxy-L-arabinose transferase-like glycosyltransferase